MATTNPFDEQPAAPHVEQHIEPQVQVPQVPQPGHGDAEVPANPAVAQLKSMFPDFDDIVLQSVLDSVNSNQDAAIDILLGMSDPSYVSTHQPTETHQPQAGSNPSLDLDEQLARQLAAEDERIQHQGRQHARGENWQRRNEGSTIPPPASSAPAGPDFQEIKETFNQLAESGKRTFSSIVSRVKAKMNEYDQNRTNTQAGQHPPPAWGGSSAAQPSYYHEPPTQPVDRHAASQSFAPYYGTAGGTEDGWQDVGPRGRQDRVAVQPQATEIRGYDLDTHEAAPPTATAQGSTPFPAPAAEPKPTTPPATTASAVSAAKPSSPTPGSPEARAASPSMDIPRPPHTNSGSPLDATKFGLLPKRPVSLLTPQTTSHDPSKPSEDDDEDELDYIENPFEDKRKAL